MKTHKFCPHCGRPVVKSRNRDYSFQCFACDADFYRSEVYNTRQIKKVWEIRRAACHWAVENGYAPYSFKKSFPIPGLIKNPRTGYVIFQQSDRPEFCADRETLFESIEIRTETDREIANFNDLHREISIYNQQNPGYKFTIKALKAAVVKHRKHRRVARLKRR